MRTAFMVIASAGMLGCAGLPTPGVYRGESGTLEILADGLLSYRAGVTRCVGSYRLVSRDVIAANAPTEEVKLSLIGREQKTEWIARESKPKLVFYVDHSDGTFKVFHAQASAVSWRDFREATNSSCLVTGQVKTPGAYRCVAGESLSAVLTRAGGVSAYGNPKTVRVYRGGKTWTVDVAAVAKGRTNDVVLLPGDQIVVERFWR